MAKKNIIREAKLSDLVPDDLNANRGSEYGTHLVENSIRKFGAGRSILLDKNNRIIAGNKTTEQAASVGLDNVIIVETTGDQIVAVKRMDIDLDSAQGREMAIADNAAAKANIQWDEENLRIITQEWTEVDPEAWGVSMDANEEIKQQADELGEEATKLEVECSDRRQLASLFGELEERGFSVRYI